MIRGENPRPPAVNDRPYVKRRTLMRHSFKIYSKSSPFPLVLQGKKETERDPGLVTCPLDN